MKITEQQATDFYKQFKKALNNFIYKFESRARAKNNQIDWEMHIMKAFNNFCEFYDPDKNIKPFTFLYACIKKEQRTVLTKYNRPKYNAIVKNIDELPEINLLDEKRNTFDRKEYEERLKNCSEQAKALFSTVVDNMEEIAGESFVKLDAGWHQKEMMQTIRKLVLKDSKKTYEWFVRVPRVEIKKALGWNK